MISFPECEKALELTINGLILLFGLPSAIDLDALTLNF